MSAKRSKTFNKVILMWTHCKTQGKEKTIQFLINNRQKVHCIDKEDAYIANKYTSAS